MKLGYTVWTWMKCEFGRNWQPTSEAKRLFENAAKDLSYLGYKTIENFSFIVPVYENNKKALDELLEECNLEFINIYYELSGKYETDKKGIERCCKFMKENNIPFLNVEAPHVPLDGPVTVELLEGMCEALNDIGKMCLDYGVTLCIHQHTRTLCETKFQLNHVLSNTNPEYVKLCLDTCHVALAGMEVEEEFANHLDRLAYVHFKDVVADYKRPYSESVTENARALGEGIIDFPIVFEILKNGGYDGPITVEVDYPNPDSFYAAKVSRDYLRDKVGI